MTAIRPGKAAVWSGWILTILLSALLIMSAVMKLTQAQPVIEGFAKFGYPASQAASIGVAELICVVLFLIPKTSVLGAILLTGYLGGATATHVRIEDNFVMPIILGCLVWLAIVLRDPRLRALIPVVQRSELKDSLTGR